MSLPASTSWIVILLSDWFGLPSGWYGYTSINEHLNKDGFQDDHTQSMYLMLSATAAKQSKTNHVTLVSRTVADGI